MKLLHQFLNLFCRRKLDAEMGEEMRLHVEMQTERNLAAGMKPEDARYAALRQFGNVASVQQLAREGRGWVWLEQTGQDIRYAARQLRRRPGFTLTALLTLALCLGANLTVFAVVDAILLRALPFPEPERLVSVFNSYPQAGYARGGVSFTNYFERRTLKAFSAVALFAEDTLIVGEGGTPQRVPMARVTPEFFEVLGVPLARGRSFTDAELTYNTDGVAVLTDEFWRTHFQSDPDVLGRTFLNDGLPVTVIGVLPPGFRYLSSRAEFFRPSSHMPQMRLPQARHSSSALMVGRLAPGVSAVAAQAELAALDAGLAPDDPSGNLLKGWGYETRVAPLHADHVREVRPVLLLLQGGSLGLLLAGLVNLLNLFLVRASVRSHETNVRQALGATFYHLVSQQALEIALLFSLGGAGGVLLAKLGMKAIAVFGADRLPLGTQIVLDGRALGVAAGLTVGGIVLFASALAWLTLRSRLAPGLAAGARTGTASRAVQRLRHGLMIAEVALAFVLLVSAGLMGLSLHRLLATDTGFNPANILTGQIVLPWKAYQTGAARRTFTERLLPAIQALPGVEEVAISNGLPFTGRVGGGIVSVEGGSAAGQGTHRGHRRSGVTSHYRTLMGIPLLQGRWLTEADGAVGAPRVCVVDRALADRYWAGSDAVGRRISYSETFDASNAVTIVGVVGSVKQNALTDDLDFGATYFPFQVFGTPFFYLSVRSAQPAETLAPAIRSAILQIDPNLPIDDLRLLQTRIDDSLVARRAPAILGSIFAAVALLLAAIGIYGVLSYTISQRGREISIRMALGAQPWQVGRHYVGISLRLLASGVVLGAVGTVAAGRFLQAVLYEVPAFHLPTLAATGLVLLTTSLCACLVPVRRAVKADPVVALRAE